MKLEQQINKYYDSLTPNEQYICECILNHKNDCIRLSIDEFAIKYHISTSGLSRFSQKIQLSGYSELRAVLRLNESNQVKNNKSIDRLMDCYNKVIEDIDQKDCTKIFKKMNSANRIIVFGEDFFQGRVAKEMKRIFLPTGKIIYDAYGHDIIQTLKKFIQEDDIIFYISLNGQSPTIIELAQEMRMRGIYMVSITKMQSNMLARLCDDNLYTQSMQIPVNEHLKYDITTPYFILIELFYIKYKMYVNTAHIPNN